MDLTWRRNQALTSNIANAETPLYRAVDIDFASELDQAFGKIDTTVSKTDSKHLDVTSHSAAHFIEDYSGATKPDGNNVDIDLEMGRLAQNNGDYTNAARLMRRQLSMIHKAITTGER